MRLCGCSQQLAERIKPAIPLRLKRFEPSVEFVEPLTPQVMDALSGNRCHIDQAGFPEHPQMFRSLGLAHSQFIGDVAHCPRALPQQFNDLQTAGFAKGRKHGRIHAANLSH